MHRKKAVLRVRNQISRNGWATVVAEDFGGRVYTVGLVDSFNHPELVLCGLSREEAHPLLRQLRDDIRSGKRYDQMLEHHVQGRQFTVMPLDDDAAEQALPVASILLGRRFHAVQLVFADDVGRFPWTKGCEIAQHMFGRPPAIH